MKLNLLVLGEDTLTSGVQRVDKVPVRLAVESIVVLVLS